MSDVHRGHELIRCVHLFNKFFLLMCAALLCFLLQRQLLCHLIGIIGVAITTRAHWWSVLGPTVYGPSGQIDRKSETLTVDKKNYVKHNFHL